MAPNTAALATSIAGLTLTGVTFKDVTALPRFIKPTDCPIFFPHPDEWFMGMQTDPNVDYIGQAGQYDVIRTLKYIYLHAASIAANPISTYYSAMASKVDALYNKIGAMNNGVAVVTSISTSQFGEIQAPQQGQLRNVFFGCFFEITFKELVNA